MEELSPEEYKAGFDYIANTFIPTKNTTTNSIKSYIKGLEDFYPEGLESFKDRLKDNKKFITAWNELHPDSKTETKQNIQGKPIMQSPQSQLKNSEAKQQNKEKPSEQTLDKKDDTQSTPDEKNEVKSPFKKITNKTERDKTKSILKELDEKNYNLNENELKSIFSNLESDNNDINDKIKLRLAKQIYDENPNDNKHRILSEKFLKNVDFISLDLIEDMIATEDAKKMENARKIFNEDEYTDLNNYLYYLIHYNEDEDNKNEAKSTFEKLRRLPENEKKAALELFNFVKKTLPLFPQEFMLNI